MCCNEKQKRHNIVKTTNIKQYKKMVNHLESMVLCGNLKSGDKISSLRQLSNDYNISLAATRYGISLLQSKGILNSRHGSGIYVASKAGKSKKNSKENSVKRIAVFVTASKLSKSYIAHAIRGVQNLASEMRCSLSMHFDYDFSILEKEAKESDAILFLGCYDVKFDKIPVCACVGLEMHKSYSGISSTVTLDPIHAAQMACDFFVERKFKKVKLFVPMNTMPVHVVRAKIFSALWTEIGELEIITDEDTNLCHINNKECGYFFVSGTICNHYAKEFREKNNRLLAEEYCVLSLDGKSLIIPEYEPVNTIGIDWGYAGKVALRETIRRIDEPGTPSRRIYLNPFLKLYNEKAR